MNPILFQKEPDPVALVDSASVDLKEANGAQLYANGDWTSVRDFSTTNGLGALSDCIRCEVTEERNGEYELEMEYPLTGWMYNSISNRCIIVAKVSRSDKQPFRIYRISKPINGIVTINARHLSYDLTGVPVGLFTAASASGAVAGLENNAAIPQPFTITTDISLSYPFAVDVPSSVRSWFGGQEGSLVDVYGGEWKFDNYTCTLMSSRGSNKGVIIKYGINMVDFEQEENLSNIWTGIIPFWKDAQTGEVVAGHILYADGSFDFEKILSVDLTEKFPNGAPSIEQLTAEGRSYIKANNIGVPDVNITVEWVPEFEEVVLCDTVQVEFEKIGTQATAKCVKTVYDVLKERYSLLQIGNVKPTIADNIAYLNKKAGYYGT